MKRPDRLDMFTICFIVVVLITIAAALGWT